MVLVFTIYFCVYCVRWFNSKRDEARRRQLDEIRIDRIQQERAISLVRMFEQGQAHNSQERYLSTDDRERRKKRVLDHFIVMQYHKRDHEMEGWPTVELGGSRDDGSPIEAITQNLPGDNAMNHHASESNKEAVIQPNTNLDGDEDHFFSRILQSTSNLVRAEKEDHAKQVTAVALSSKMCPICLEDYKNSDQVCHSKSECGHIYHLACLMNWMIQNDDCPICRAVFLPPVSDRDSHSSEDAPFEAEQ